MQGSELKTRTRIWAFGAALATPFGCSLLIDGELDGLQLASAGHAGAAASDAERSELPDDDTPVPAAGAPGRGGAGSVAGFAGEGGVPDAGGEGGGTPSHSGAGGTPAGTTWELVDGLARDIAHGADGSVWIIGTDPIGYGDLAISKWAGATWASANGGGIRVAVGPNGAPWTVNAKGEIYRHSSDPNVGVWQLQPGSASDIAVGADGSVWIVATSDLGNNDYGICKWNGSGCESTDGGAVRIAVAPDGVPWIVNRANEIYRRTSNGPVDGYWQQMPGHASDIAAGAEGSVWIISTERVGFDDFRIAAWDEQADAGQWVSGDAAGVAISVDPNGSPWIVNAAGQIQRFRVDVKRTP
jgi:hypothetical protein